MSIAERTSADRGEQRFQFPAAWGNPPKDPAEIDEWVRNWVRRGKEMRARGEVVDWLTPETRSTHLDLELRDMALQVAASAPPASAAAANGAKIAGVAVPFMKLSNSIFRLGADFYEQFTPDAFSLQDQAADWSDVEGRFAHIEQFMVASVRGGSMSVNVTPGGLVYAMTLPASLDYVAELVARGDTPGASIGFYALGQTWDDVDGALIRTVTDAFLYEVSICGMPCYPAATAGLVGAGRSRRGRRAVISAPSRFGSTVTGIKAAMETLEAFLEQAGLEPVPSLWQAITDVLDLQANPADELKPVPSFSSGTDGDDLEPEPSFSTTDGFWADPSSSGRSGKTLSAASKSKVMAAMSELQDLLAAAGEWEDDDPDTQPIGDQDTDQDSIALALEKDSVSGALEKGPMTIAAGRALLARHGIGPVSPVRARLRLADLQSTQYELEALVR